MMDEHKSHCRCSTCGLRPQVILEIAEEILKEIERRGAGDGYGELASKGLNRLHLLK